MNLTLKNKIYQLFILGTDKTELDTDKNLRYCINCGLGGVIFFTKNIISVEQFKNFTTQIKKISQTGMFLSIDQEGGRVERTENIHNGKKYLSALYTKEKGEIFAKRQSTEIANELISYGLNMNFAPVLDVNTNPQNPIIGERAYGSTPDEVIKYGEIVYESFMRAGIIPVCKHFPGHGDTNCDSHLELPTDEHELDYLEQIHIKPFLHAIANNIPAIMVSHVHYKAFDETPTPASLSKNIIQNYLINKLNYKGLIISDDMIMGAINQEQAINNLINGLNAGLNMFIFRNSDDSTIALIDEFAEKIAKNKNLLEKVYYSCDKIATLKNKFQI